MPCDVSGLDDKKMRHTYIGPDGLDILLAVAVLQTVANVVRLVLTVATRNKDHAGNKQVSEIVGVENVEVGVRRKKDVVNRRPDAVA